jgi:hypothetical protein
MQSGVVIVKPIKCAAGGTMVVRIVRPEHKPTIRVFLRQLNMVTVECEYGDRRVESTEPGTIQEVR